MRALPKENSPISIAAEQATLASAIVKDLATSKSGSASDKISNLRAALGEIMSSIVTAEAYQNKLQAEIAELKRELAVIKDWEAERDTFELRRFDPGVFAYRRRPASILQNNLSKNEASYLLCPCCFDRKKKSILQSTPKIERRYQVHICPECQSEFAFYYAPNETSI